jgi:para-nitrobenzyl esterase
MKEPAKISAHNKMLFKNPLLPILLVFAMIAYKPGPTRESGQAGLSGPVRVESGLLTGDADASGEVTIFRGIPFAAPPVGDLRWKEPQPAMHWEGVKSCTRFSPAAMQARPLPFGVYTSEFLIPDTSVNEDCLYLNIWTAAKSSKEKRPVIVWIHGGGFINGSGAVPIYDGVSMAKKGIVFVTINYRLGIFGFFSHPSLAAESPHHASGNYGILDQIAAVKWVKRNIEAFGGDPGNITIDGQSAGSMSVNCLMASPLASGLFRHAIAESGALFIPNPLTGMISLQKDEEEGKKMEQSLHVSSLADLRKIPATRLQAMSKVFGYAPIIDGYLLPQSIAEIFDAGKQNDADLMTGLNEDDGILFGPPRSATGFQEQVGHQFGKDADQILKYYPANGDAEAVRSQLALSRDMIFGVQNYRWAKIEAARRKGNVYLYHFSRRLPATRNFVKYGAFHSGEIVYALDNLPFLHRPWEDKDRILAGVMSSCWINFARSGNPNGAGLAPWPAFEPGARNEMLFSEQPGSRGVPDDEALEFLSQALARQ